MNGARASTLVVLSSILGACQNGGMGDAGPGDAVDIVRPRDAAPYEAGPLDAGDTGPVDAVVVDTPPPSEAGDVIVAVDAADVVMQDVGVDVPMVDTMTHVRVANVMTPPSATVAPPTVDFCARPSGTTMAFLGPLLAAYGTSAGVAGNQVTAYLALPPGNYDVVVIAAGATTCASPIVPMLAPINVATAGQYSTLALFGVGAPIDAGVASFGARLLSDHPPGDAPTLAQPLLRVFNAIPAAYNFDVGIVADVTMPATSFEALFGNVSFGNLGHPAPGLAAAFDAQLYFNGSAMTNLTVGARITGMTGAPQLMLSGLSILDHTITTAFLTQHGNGTAVVPGVLLCSDAAMGPAGYSACAFMAP